MGDNMHYSTCNLYNLYDFRKLETNQGFTESEDTAEEENTGSDELQSDVETVEYIDYSEKLDTIIQYQEKIYNSIMCLLYFTILAFIIKFFFKQIFSWLNGA